MKSQLVRVFVFLRARTVVQNLPIGRTREIVARIAGVSHGALTKAEKDSKAAIIKTAGICEVESIHESRYATGVAGSGPTTS